ncbi:hypothetical protein A2U01_0109908, partial [Trifolium medium]|nr:hypothetical protein [Trifolium medium]
MTRKVSVACDPAKA